LIEPGKEFVAVRLSSVAMRRYLYLIFFVAVSGFVSIVSARTVFAQIQYKSGVDVTPAYEGWMRNPDGTFSLLFGYLNRNYEEELEIPIGPNNTIEPGGDRGQPTHFYPRRQHFVFRVVVPSDWGLDRRVVWTLTIRGKTNTAKGWLQPEWELDKEIIMANGEGGGSDDDNEAPTLTGSPTQTITLPNTATLTVTGQDDGRPMPRSERADSPAMSIRWIQYRSPGPVDFDPPEMTFKRPAPADFGKPISSTTKASFKIPGTYILRAIASDGSLETAFDVTVEVK
jgi:hypothetical protein